MRPCEPHPTIVFGLARKTTRYQRQIAFAPKCRQKPCAFIFGQRFIFFQLLRPCHQLQIFVERPFFCWNRLEILREQFQCPIRIAHTRIRLSEQRQQSRFARIFRQRHLTNPNDRPIIVLLRIRHRQPVKRIDIIRPQPQIFFVQQTNLTVIHFKIVIDVPIRQFQIHRRVIGCHFNHAAKRILSIQIAQHHLCPRQIQLGIYRLRILCPRHPKIRQPLSRPRWSPRHKHPSQPHISLCRPSIPNPLAKRMICLLDLPRIEIQIAQHNPCIAIFGRSLHSFFQNRQRIHDL